MADVSPAATAGQDGPPWTAAWRAVCRSSPDEVRAALSAAAKAGGDARAWRHASRGQSLVFFAAARVEEKKEGERRCVLRLLIEEHGLSAKAQDRMGQTALFYAAKLGDVGACSYLIDRRCDADHVDNNQQTALFYAAERGHEDCVGLLLERQCEVGRVDSNSKSVLSCTQNVACLERLFRSGGDASAPDVQGRLFEAAARGNSEMLELLLRHRADVQARTATGATCLFEAAQAGHLEICRRLVEHRADVHHQDNRQRTAQWKAQRSRRSRAVLAFLSAQEQGVGDAAAEALREALRAWRSAAAAAAGRPERYVLTNQVLDALADASPTTTTGLWQVQGMTQRTMSVYGAQMLAVLQQQAFGLQGRGPSPLLQVTATDERQEEQRSVAAETGCEAPAAAPARRLGVRLRLRRAPPTKRGAELAEPCGDGQEEPSVPRHAPPPSPASPAAARYERTSGQAEKRQADEMEAEEAEEDAADDPATPQPAPPASDAEGRTLLALVFFDLAGRELVGAAHEEALDRLLQLCPWLGGWDDGDGAQSGAP